MLGPNFREAPDVMERVIERSRRSADPVRLSEIAFYAGGLRCRLQQSLVINDSPFLTRSVPILSESVDDFGGDPGRSRV